MVSRGDNKARVTRKLFPKHDKDRTGEGVQLGTQTGYLVVLGSYTGLLAMIIAHSETYQPVLVGGLEHLFSIVYGLTIPTDFHIFQRGWNHQPEYNEMG